MKFLWFTTICCIFSLSLFAEKTWLDIHDKKIAVYSNKEIFKPRKNIRRALIIVHGAKRKVSGNLKTFKQILTQKSLEQKILVIAPKFKLIKEIGDLEELYWEDAGWKKGDGALNSAEVSSFSVIDELVKKLVDKNNYPNLKEIYLVGHSAGGQMVHRYALLNKTLEDYEQSYQFKFFVLNPSSYVYLTDERPVPLRKNKFDTPYNENGTLKNAFAFLADAPDYNCYKYGLQQRVNYALTSSDEEILEHYKNRDVSYGLGLLDVDPDDALLDKTPEAMFQGLHRLDRGRHYFLHLYRALPGNNHRLIEVPDIGHDSNGMIRALREYLAGNL